MFFVCQACGEWSTDRPVVDGEVVCQCGDRRPISLRPTLVLTGASASGKTTIGNQLLGRLSEVVVLDADILWGPEMNTPEDDYARFRSTWLRMVSNIQQAGRSTLLVGSGVPEQFESRPERRYVGPMHWMALVCDDTVLEERLRARPKWRGVTDESIETMKKFNAQLRGRQDMQVVDTTHLDVAETAAHVSDWCRTVLASEESRRTR